MSVEMEVEQKKGGGKWQQQTWGMNQWDWYLYKVQPAFMKRTEVIKIRAYILNALIVLWPIITNYYIKTIIKSTIECTNLYNLLNYLYKKNYMLQLIEF